MGLGCRPISQFGGMGQMGELGGGPAAPPQGAKLSHWHAWGCFQLWPPGTHYLLAQAWVWAPNSPALEDAPATQRVLGLEAAGAVRELRAGSHGYPVHLDGQWQQRW